MYILFNSEIRKENIIKIYVFYFRNGVKFFYN